MSIYISKNNQSKKISKIYTGINGQSKKISKGYIGVNNQSRLFYNSTYYNELSYLRGAENGKAYINTHLELNEYHTIELSGMCIGNTRILGYENTSWNEDYGHYVTSDSFYLYSYFKNNGYGLKVFADEAYPYDGNLIYQDSGTKAYLYSNFKVGLLMVDSDSDNPNELKCRIIFPSGYNYTFVNSTFNSEGHPLLLFTTSNHGTPTTNTNSSSLYIYNVKILNRALGYKLIMDLVPCRRNDGVLGMYDKINKNFYQNEGQGYFTGGNETSNIYYD